MVAVSLTAQERKYYTPEKGDWSVGVIFNPASMSSQMLAQPKPGDFVGKWISDNAASPHQMFMLSQDPVAAVRVKYRTSRNWSVRASVGFNGSLVNYREYVPDDLALALDPDSQNQVVDEIQSRMNSGSLMLGCEYMSGGRAVRFVFGADLLYSIAGGRLCFDYGNKMTDLNHMGIEVFLDEKISAGLTMNFTPVAVTFQPETYTVYEGFSTYTGKVESYTGYVSPGSNALLYGIENFGARLSLNYYF